VESLCKGDKRGEGAGLEFFDDFKERCCQREASSFGLVFDIHEGAEGVHFFIEGFESWVFEEELEEAFMVKGGEVVGAFAQGSEQAPMVLDMRGDLTCEIHEVLDDETDDMEAVGDDFSIWEVGGDEAAVRTGEVDTDHAHLIFAL